MEDKAVQICRLNGKERADKLIAALFTDLSRNRIQKLIDDGHVRINREPIDNGSHKLIDKDLIEIHIPAPVKVDIKPKDDIELNIIYEDDDLLVINKQAGLTVHPGAGNHDDTMVNALLAKITDLSGINGELRPGIVHRLDRDTTGLMLVAKHDEAHNFLAEGIQTRDVVRVYHALVWNAPELPGGRIETHIGRHPRDRKKMAALKRSGKQAITHYTVVERFFNNTLSLIECRLETGRTHQIRVHFEHKGMPLVGDQTYMGQPTQKRTGMLPEKVLKAVKYFPRQALHAKYIAFTHPSTGEIMEFEIDYPDDYKKLLKDIGYNLPE